MTSSTSADKPLQGKRIVVTGGTGSLGKLLVTRLLSGEIGDPEAITVFSRDEAKQHQMRLDYLQQASATDEVIFQNFERKVNFWIGDIRDFDSVSSVLRDADVVFNAAALKQVPTCEYFPYEAVKTNIGGAENIVKAIEQHGLGVETVVGVSTDKACKPVNVMGMTKALQERVFIQANMRTPDTRFICVRYGNVLASRGSVIPLFHDQIRAGGPVTITTADMTRFLLSLDQAIDTLFAAVWSAKPGETFVPNAPSALVTDIAAGLIGDRKIDTNFIGIRPGEKLHEAMVSDEEAPRTRLEGDWYAIRPMLPEMSDWATEKPALSGEFSSEDRVLTAEQTRQLLVDHRLMLEDVNVGDGELIR
ncbi:MAG TPA: NAD-dependent epimerase/dehydratase family protein [Dehalococcoidia bacterium]|nr:NAD-dependent epimerase/dehydratase family protein [Dehalococcoidia bacterium]HIK98893.1 NAD-dependent epimerase/dehydratase family protein [Dehalococcoidia bacterium]